MLLNNSTLNLAMAMAKHAGLSHVLASQNVVNVDTPGYRSNEISSFQDIIRRYLPSGKNRTPSEPRQAIITASEIFDGDHLKLSGNTISLDRELLHAISSKRQHDKALAIYHSNTKILNSVIKG